MIAQPLPQSDLNAFSVLYHLTSLDSAKKILTSGVFVSYDPDLQASFSAIITRSDIARSQEICLRFRWPGTQAMYFGDPFGHGEPHSVGLTKPILYHIFYDSPLAPGQRLRSKKYWQSNIYPGSSGLIFDGIYAIHKQEPKIPRKPCRVFFWSYGEKLKNYEEVRAKHIQIKELQELASKKINSIFSV